jgi:hypothetical protein
MRMSNRRIISGSCSCGELTYQLRNAPLFVHACHCLICQRRTGSAFGITVIILESDFKLTNGKLVTESISDMQRGYRCQSCSDPVYMISINHPTTALLSSKTLEDLRYLFIGAHIWTKRKHKWLEIPSEVPTFDEGYDRNLVWPQESLARLTRELETAP